MGATYKNKSTGRYADISITSFYGSHIINCAGNGGALCLNDKEVYDYTVSKYGLTEINNVKQYETRQIKNSRGVVVLRSGEIVDSDFTINYYDGRNITTSTSETSRAISNYEYEVRENQKKRTIDVLRSEYLQQFLNDIRKEMTYKRSSQFVNDKLIKTENTRITNLLFFCKFCKV